ncbi:MAG: ATP-binding SpoIIE family protein phosphatase [Coleofasciculaceae cyanobacterium]
MNDAFVLSISESSQVGEARRLALGLASRLGFDETERGKVGIVVTEVANNLVQHAENGKLLLQVVQKNQQSGIEIIGLDQSPGMNNVGECLRDGFSTKGTPGNGLGAIRRLATVFEIHSQPQLGTVVLAQLWKKPKSNCPEKLELSAICLPIKGEEVSGDAWATTKSGDDYLILVADGLGHGVMAAEAAAVAVRVFKEKANCSLTEIIEAMHGAMRHTRGAALAIAKIDLEQQILQFVGVGNITGTIQANAATTRMVSHNGTVGHELRKIQIFTYPWHQDAVLIMHSDGLGSHWNINRYPGLATRHPSLIAGVLYRDFNRGRDDVTVLVAREDN